MKLYKIIEYLLYLWVFILMFKLSEAATVNRTDESTTRFSNRNSTFLRNRENRKLGFGSCEEGLSWMCLKMEFVNYIERLTEKEEISLLPGFEIVRDKSVTQPTPVEMFAEISRSYPNDKNSRLNGYMVSKLTNYMQSHFLRLRLFDNKTISEARSLVETARHGKDKKGGGMEALIAAGIVMKGTLMALAMGGLAMLAGKALTAALMALLLSALVALKNLGGGKESKSVIIAKHHIHDDHGHGHAGAYDGYARTFQLEKPSF